MSSEELKHFMSEQDEIGTRIEVRMLEFLLQWDSAGELKVYEVKHIAYLARHIAEEEIHRTYPK